MMIDYLIIGQGLAGSLLAWELMQRGCTVVIVDNGVENASQIAAGLINPVTGMRFVKSSETDIQLPAAKNCYSNLSVFFNQQFLIEKPMFRIFKSEDEKTAASKRLNNPDYLNYIGNIRTETIINGNLATPFGYLEQKQTGFLLTRPLLECMKELFISRNCYRQTKFDYQEIEFDPILRWQDFYPKVIIFCEGFQATRNPWFSWLPFQPVKGEIITLKHKATLPDKIINHGNWLIPIDASQIRIGATFDRENLNTQITEEGKNELLNSLSQLTDVLSDSTLTSHKANVRPCTKDRQPFIGRHPERSQLTIFNGFGAKGSLQIPWYSQRFADHLLSGTLLPPSCNIRRHSKKIF